MIKETFVSSSDHTTLSIVDVRFAGTLPNFDILDPFCLTIASLVTFLLSHLIRSLQGNQVAISKEVIGFGLYLGNQRLLSITQV